MAQKGVIPPQFLKHPPKSWRRDKRKIAREARADIAKEHRKRGYGMAREKRRGRRKGEYIHIVPDALGVAAVAQPFINGDNTSGDNALSYLLRNGGGDISTTLEGTVWRVKENIVPAAKDAAILGVFALAAQWLGKELGLNRVGTKKVKLA